MEIFSSCYQTEMVDSKDGTELLDIILTKVNSIFSQGLLWVLMYLFVGFIPFSVFVFLLVLNSQNTTMEYNFHFTWKKTSFYFLFLNMALFI